MPVHELIPSARRLIRSLRDMGYDFAQAVADLVDNSIEAKATHVAIDIEFDGDDSWVRLADNGHGMKPERLREALRFGSERDYTDEDLGKFGLGLKTASMSQCQRLSVASRWNASRGDIAAYAWDLDHITQTNRWELLEVERNALGPAIRNPLKEGPGTVVLWERLDRILGFKHPYGESARKQLAKMCRELEIHLGMVFHRFISGEARGRRLHITINGNVVLPWDPFCRLEKATKALSPITLAIEDEGKKGSVVMEPYILPHRDDFSSEDAWARASGPANWNQQQGFYIYRANRLIQSGGWSNLQAPDEHLKLARIAVSFAPMLDDAFKINVAKMRVQLPSVARKEIREATAPVRALARSVYDKKEKGSSAHGGSVPAPKLGNSTVAVSGGEEKKGALAGESANLTWKLVKKQLLELCTKTERAVVEKVLARLPH